jgi:ParB-like chromosome segregation protein Spo0J
MPNQNDSAYLSIAEIVVSEDRREIDADTVKSIAGSIATIGLQYPITVRNVGGVYHLVAGRHRLEACRSLGHLSIDCTVVDMDDIDARLWEISENLDRADLNKLDRGILLAKWIKLIEEKHVQVGQVSAGGRGKAGGEAAACRDLGVTRQTARRAKRIASISPEAMKFARELGLENDQSKLLDVAREKPEEQVEKVKQLSRAKTQKPAKKRKRAAVKQPDQLPEPIAEIWPRLRDVINALIGFPPVSECISVIRSEDEAGLVDRHGLAANDWLQQLMDSWTRGEEPTPSTAAGGDNETP